MTNLFTRSDHNHPPRIGVMGCSSFALRAMIPAASRCTEVTLAAIASRDFNKAKVAAVEHNCRAVESYDALVTDPHIDAIYVPLPTGLHREWVLKAINAGKHLLVEKSLAANDADAREMIKAARENRVALLENFLFLRHSQIGWIREQLDSNKIGTWKYFRATFTIPKLDDGNFRYNKQLGGGALLDLGAYMSKSAEAFLGADLTVTHAAIDESPARGVDMGGTASFFGSNSVRAQVLWAFDTQYQSTWEFLGDRGRILCFRALTPPPGFNPPVRIECGESHDDFKLPEDDHYQNQWRYFASLIRDNAAREAELDACARQADRIELIRNFKQI